MSDSASPSTPPPPPPSEQPVCHCCWIMPAQIQEAIKQGANTVTDLQVLTTACTGCGSCRWDLEAILREAGRDPEGKDACVG